MSTQLSDLNEAGVPILAVGAGWELLGKSLELVNGSIVETLGFFPSKSRHVPVRASCESYGHDFKGNLTAGYSNHSAEIELEEGVSPLVSLLAGNGNSSITDAKTRSDEGLIHSNLMASRLNGPLLPLNPHLADHLLMIGLERVGASLPESTPEMEIADGYAYRAREGIEKRLAR
jgi:CobQ-like glutamine amidotransferase family enzyme